MPWWGMLAGGLLMVDGDALLRSRWAPGTLALGHIFTLGILGNAMFGSMLQFLPVAAGVRVRGSATFAPWLHGLFNLGALALVVGLYRGWQVALMAAALLLPLAFVLLAAMTLPGLLAAAGQRLVHAGFGLAIAFAVLTALLGGALALALTGTLALPLPLSLRQLANVHASWGVLGWVIVLIATVARVVMPMFQGTDSMPARAQATWLCSVALTLLGAACWYLVGGSVVWLRGVVAVHAFAFAVAALWLQWSASHLRKVPLVWSWRAGLLMLALAALVLVAGDRFGLLAAALGLGIALPLLVVGMAQEIIAFIGWIDLRRHCEGIQVPGVQRLLPARDKTLVLLAQLPLLLLPFAVLWPSPWLARTAGLALLLAWLAVAFSLHGVRWRARRFQQSVVQRATNTRDCDVAHT